MNLVTIGTIFVDVKGRPFDTYIPAGRNAGDVHYFHGGVARNIAEDIANVGEGSTFVGLSDFTGEGCNVINHLQSVGVNTDYIVQTHDGMGMWLAVFNEKGDVVASISKRPDLLPICDILKERGDEIFSKADSLLIEMDIDQEILDAAMNLAVKYNIPIYGVISNMSLGMERLDYIKRSELFICNSQECGILFNCSVEGLTPFEMVELMQKEMQKMGLKTLVVTMGGEGCAYVCLKDGEAGVCPAHDVEIVDTTGCGDSFFAGACVGLTRGKSLREACELGTKMACNVIGSMDNVYHE